jgi:hypothetical protein
MSDDFLNTIKEKYKNRIICVASPSPEKTDYRYNIALIELIVQNSPLLQMRLHKAVSSRIAVNRNNIVRDARAVGATDILWIDTDSKFPINGLLRLLEHDKDIIGATTCQRNGDGIPVGTQLEIGVQAPLIKMAMIGFPFILTRMSVFDKMDELWPQGKGVYFAEPPRWKCPEINTVNDGLIGEDEYFCHLAISAGFDIWCDMEMTTEIGHIGSTVFYISPNNLIVPEGKVDEKL